MTRTDQAQHIASKKHRRFAANDENFEDLDNLLCMLQRPNNPAIRDLDCPPCVDRHGKDDDCDFCDEVNRSYPSSDGWSDTGHEEAYYSEGGSGDV